MLQKDAYPYEYMEDWQKSNETSLTEKEDFHIRLNMEYITDADYKYVNRVFKNFEIRNFGDLHFQSDTLLLADVSNYFWNMPLKIHEPDPAHILSTQGLAGQGALKKAEVLLDL